MTRDARSSRYQRGGRDSDQMKSFPVSSRVIMRTKAFQAGVADVRQGRGYRPAYESAGVNEQWNYERGRAWALIAGPRVPVADASGEPTLAALKIFDGAGNLIL